MPAYRVRFVPFPAVIDGNGALVANSHIAEIVFLATRSKPCSVQ